MGAEVDELLLATTSKNPGECKTTNSATDFDGASTYTECEKTTSKEGLRHKTYQQSREHPI